MTTIINTPQPAEGPNSAIGVVLGVILAVIIIALFFIYLVPAIRGTSYDANTTPQQTDSAGGVNLNVTMPTGASSSVSY